MRIRTKQWLMFVGILGITLILSGCFFSEQSLVIGPDGKADVKVEFWFDKIQAGDQGSIAIQELHYLFPELQDYEMTRTEKRIEYTTYLVYSFQADGVDINKNQYIDFVNKDDGSYSLTIRIPKAIEETKEKNDKVLTIKVTMPAEIDMANTINYEGRTAEWELRTNDFARDITLKVFTESTAQQIESLEYNWPSDVVIGFVEAVEKSNLEIAYQYWQDKELAKDAAQALMKKEKEWGKWGPMMTVHHIGEINPEEYLIMVPFHLQGNANFAKYLVKRFNGGWLIISQEFQEEEVEKESKKLLEASSHYKLAKNYMAEDNIEKAEIEFKKALKIAIEDHVTSKNYTMEKLQKALGIEDPNENPENMFLVDADNDGEEEILVTLRGPWHTGPKLIFCLDFGKEGNNCYFLGYGYEVVSIEVDDINKDGKTEIIVSDRGGSGGYLGMCIYAWDSGKYKKLWETKESSYHGSYNIKDRDADGIKEIILFESLHDESIFSESNWGPHLRETTVLKWNGGSYTEIAAEPVKDSFYCLNSFLENIQEAEYQAALEQLSLKRFFPWEKEIYTTSDLETYIWENAPELIETKSYQLIFHSDENLPFTWANQTEKKGEYKLHNKDAVVFDIVGRGTEKNFIFELIKEKNIWKIIALYEKLKGEL